MFIFWPNLKLLHTKLSIKCPEIKFYTSGHNFWVCICKFKQKINKM